MLEDRVEALLADKGYDADAIREEIAAAGVEAVIPSKSNRRVPIPHDREKYRWRNLVERLFSKLKNWRRVATRYDKTKESYLGFVTLASIKLWIPFVHAAYIKLWGSLNFRLLLYVRGKCTEVYWRRAGLCVSIRAIRLSSSRSPCPRRLPSDVIDGIDASFPAPSWA